MASRQDDAVFDQDLDEDSSSSSQSQEDDVDDLENDDALMETGDVLVDEEDEEEEEDLAPVSVPVAVPSASAVTVAAIPNGSLDPQSAAIKTEPSGDMKRQRLSPKMMTPTATAATTLIVEEKKPAPQQLDESRRLFQRLWTDEDEIELLQGFLDYTSQRGTHHPDTALFYDQIKSKLQLDFNKNQLVEKLRRLKKKYRNVMNKINSGKDFSFKSPHDQATFEISRKIWSNTTHNTNLDDDDQQNPASAGSGYLNYNDSDVRFDDQRPTPRSRKRSRPRSGSAVRLDDRRLLTDGFGSVNVENNANNNKNNNNNGSGSGAGAGGGGGGGSGSGNGSVTGVIEETVRSCLSPLFKELLSNVMMMGSGGGVGRGIGIGGLAMNAMPLSFGGGEMMVDEKWRKQQILELEVYSKRLELVQDQIRAQLEELRSVGGG